ncbi:MAG: cytochrome c [Nitrospinota bacterium]|nr:cytochrome c [Nitrospinota bacterium]
MRWWIVFLFVAGSAFGCSGESITASTGSGIGPSGKSLFFSRTKGGCSVCHKVADKKLVGPGLEHVSKLHSREWLVQWVTDPAKVWEENSMETVGMKKRLNKNSQAVTAMKIMNPLTKEEIEAIVDYLMTL